MTSSMMNNRLQLYCQKYNTCFVDFKKAYDSAWHDGLFYKFNKVGISGYFLGLLKDTYAKNVCS